MRQKKVVIGVAVLMLTLSAVLGATVLREPIAFAAQPVTGVIVGNTASQPVPVTGTIQVADGRVPFETRLNVQAEDGVSNASNGFDVPTGKRLVVEFISVFVGLPKGQKPLVGINAESGGLGFIMPLNLEGTRANSIGTFDDYTGAMKTLDFAHGGDQYRVSFERAPSGVYGPTPGAASLTAYISGYLENE